MGRFDGRTVLVTGAGSGIGFEMADAFQAEGATVYAADIAPAGCPDRTNAVPLDVTDEAAVRGVVQRILTDTGRLDVVCNNAGIGSTADPLTCTAEEWDRVFAV
ncbi:SDR family NAD(P)-dependent oxidoreductase, partial [Jatrophihabitans sp.]|uniref:SDR family NAD(P)-dependent oxidoreductase n=1 Tax=Jatrophihabitans sp. TaxID=1932789 RepID=UPI002F24DA8A